MQRVSRLGRDLAEALEGLHDEGLTHRDVKPDNILFINGLPCLADIGAMTRGESRGSVVALGYTAPEGAGEPRADVFSLGRTLFFASSGSDPLYQLGSYPEAYYEQEWRDRKRLEQVIDRASRQLSKARYPSMHAMRGELEPLAPVRNRPSLKGWWMGGLSALGMAGIAAGLAWHDVPPFGRDEVLASPRGRPLKPEPVTPREETKSPRECLLRVLVVSRTGRDVPGAELCLGTESHAVNWNDDPDRWRPANQTLSALTGTPLYVSVRAPGYTPQDVDVFSLEGSESEDMPQLVNVALAAKPGALARSEPWMVFERGASAPLTFAEDGRHALVAERTHRFELIHPSWHGVKAWALFVEPGASYTVPFKASDEMFARSLPVMDPRVRAPWTNSLGMGFVHAGETCPEILWACHETRLMDFRAFCEETGRDPSRYDTDLWDALRDAREFVERLEDEDRRRFEALDGERARRRFIETHVLPSEHRERLRHPVTKVSLDEIGAFAGWLTRRERERGLLPERLAYRLPTDLEWSALVGIGESVAVRDPERSGLTLLNLVEAEVITREALRRRGFRMSNLSNVVINAEVLDSFESDTRALVRRAVERQQLKMRIGRAHRESPRYAGSPGIHVAGRDTVPVERTVANGRGIHGLEGNVSEVMQDSLAFYQMVLRGPSFHTRLKGAEPTSELNLRTRMLAPKDVRNLSFGFRLVLAELNSEEISSDL